MSGTELRAPANFDRIAVAETFALDGRDPFDSTLEAATADASVSFRNATFGGDVELGGGGSAGVGRHWCPVDGRLALRSAVVVGDAALDRITVDDLDATGLEVAVHVANRHVRAAGPVRARELDLTDLRAESMTLARAVVDELNLQGAQVVARPMSS